MNKITATVKRADHTADETWGEGTRSWRVTLHYQGRRMTAPFHQGSGHTEEPTAADVLYCVTADACGYENCDSFEGWCREYGYEPDSRKAEQIHKTVARQTKKLRVLLGSDYERLVSADEDAITDATAQEAV